MNINEQLISEFSLKPFQIENTVALIDDGNTIPFISRYRKEATGSLDDQLLREIFDRLTYLRGLEKRKDEVRESIISQEKMTDEIEAALAAAVTLSAVEDIYRPYKQKRKTRASVAKEKGLEPLAQLIFAQQEKSGRPEDYATQYINEEKGVADADEALAGALDIIAEDISDNAEFRGEIRRMTYNAGFLVSKAADEKTESVYTMYYDYREKLSAVPGHRLLAINRGEKEELLKVSLEMDEYPVISFLINRLVIPGSIFSPLVDNALRDSYNRLIKPSIERELRSDSFDSACEGALKVFAQNLKHLLLTPPIKDRTVLGFDPGYRTGCKLAVVDSTGKVLDTAVIYPTKPQERIAESEKTVLALVKKHKINTVAIGNGTASKESEIFISNVIKNNSLDCKYMMVSEAGASVYSASKLAAEEFPDYDVTLRSAVSIARRLQDPLAELVKIDPKSIGVGQYQHDMKPQRLNESLSGVVEDAVNSVGVDVNTASYMLLSYLAGINLTAAKNIVRYREENGAFTSRAQLKKVPRVGDKAYEQCAGFMRIPGAKEPLDNSSVHPESYKAASGLIEHFGYTKKDIASGGIKGLSAMITDENAGSLAENLKVGIPTLRDIAAELEKPGRDIREDFAQPILRDDILELSDLREGMELTGTVRNVCDFGAFVDIGVHQDGLVHVSQISNKFIRHPGELLSVGDIVKVKVISVDAAKKRIGLTMKI